MICSSPAYLREKAVCAGHAEVIDRILYCCLAQVTTSEVIANVHWQYG